jgi:hypothetical protein
MERPFESKIDVLWELGKAEVDPAVLHGGSARLACSHSHRELARAWASCDRLLPEN